MAFRPTVHKTGILTQKRTFQSQLDKFSVLPKTARSANKVENSHSFFNVFYTWNKSLMESRHKFKDNRFDAGSFANFLPTLSMIWHAKKKLNWKVTSSGGQHLLCSMYLQPCHGLKTYIFCIYFSFASLH